MLGLDGSISEMHLLKIKSALVVEEEDDEDIDENISSLFWTHLQEQETTKNWLGFYPMLAGGACPAWAQQAPHDLVTGEHCSPPLKTYSIIFKVS